jgi:hypothetical protein
MTQSQEELREAWRELNNEMLWVSEEEQGSVADFWLSKLSLTADKIRREERENLLSQVVEFIKDKSERVTEHLWYVSDQCLEDVPRFFSSNPPNDDG